MGYLVYRRQANAQVGLAVDSLPGFDYDVIHYNKDNPARAVERFWETVEDTLEKCAEYDRIRNSK